MKVWEGKRPRAMTWTTPEVVRLDAATGKLIYLERISESFAASPVVAGDLLYFPAESGITYVIRAGNALEVVARNDLGSPILASPAVVNGQLFLRTAEELVCIGE